MRRWLVAGLLISFSALVIADEVIYERTNKEGVPSFSDQAPTAGEDAKTIDIKTTEPSEKTSAQQEALKTRSKAIDDSMSQYEQTKNRLDMKVKESQAALVQAQADLDSALKQQSDGGAEIAGDHVIEDDLIYHLKRKVAEAKEQLAADQANYHNFVNSYTP